jgi:hypothetical protein
MVLLQKLETSHTSGSILYSCGLKRSSKSLPTLPGQHPFSNGVLGSATSLRNQRESTSSDVLCICCKYRQAELCIKATYKVFNLLEGEQELSVLPGFSVQQTFQVVLTRLVYLRPRLAHGFYVDYMRNADLHSQPANLALALDTAHDRLFRQAFSSMGKLLDSMYLLTVRVSP